MVEALGSLFFRIGVWTNELDSGLKTAESKIAKSATAWRTLMNDVLNAVGLNQIGEMAKEWMNEFLGAEQATQRLAAAIKATGGVVGFTAEDLASYATELQGVTTFADEEIMSAMSRLVQFKSVSGDAFKSAMQLALDMAASGFGSAESAALMLGKALSDPVRGTNALRRAGVLFTDEQKAQIKGYVDSNQLLKAQQLILDSIAAKFGGVARELGAVDSGRWVILNNAISDTKEVLGQAVLPIFLRLAEAKLVAYRAGAMLAQVFIAIDRATGGVLSTSIAAFTIFSSVATAIVTLSAALKLYNVTMGTTITLMGILKVLSGWGAVIVGVTAVLGGLIVAVRGLANWLLQSAGFAAAWNKVKTNLMAAWKAITQGAMVMLEIVGTAFHTFLKALFALFGFDPETLGEDIATAFGRGLEQASVRIRQTAEVFFGGFNALMIRAQQRMQDTVLMMRLLVGVLTGLDLLYVALGGTSVFEELLIGTDAAKTSAEGLAAETKKTAEAVSILKGSMVGIEDLWMQALKAGTPATTTPLVPPIPAEPAPTIAGPGGELVPGRLRRGELPLSPEGPPPEAYGPPSGAQIMRGEPLATTVSSPELTAVAERMRQTNAAFGTSVSVLKYAAERIGAIGTAYA